MLGHYMLLDKTFKYTKIRHWIITNYEFLSQIIVFCFHFAIVCYSFVIIDLLSSDFDKRTFMAKLTDLILQIYPGL